MPLVGRWYKGSALDYCSTPLRSRRAGRTHPVSNRDAEPGGAPSATEVIDEARREQLNLRTLADQASGPLVPRVWASRLQTTVAELSERHGREQNSPQRFSVFGATGCRGYTTPAPVLGAGVPGVLVPRSRCRRRVTRALLVSGKQ